MATVHKPAVGEVNVVARPGEPFPRPYVTLRDGRVMSFKEWTDAGQPS